jgi:hypothetical protein
MQIISAIFQGEVITAGFGKLLSILKGHKKSRGRAVPIAATFRVSHKG